MTRIIATLKHLCKHIYKYLLKLSNTKKMMTLRAIKKNHEELLHSYNDWKCCTTSPLTLVMQGKFNIFKQSVLFESRLNIGIVSSFSFLLFCGLTTRDFKMPMLQILVLAFALIKKITECTRFFLDSQCACTNILKFCTIAMWHNH